MIEESEYPDFFAQLDESDRVLKEMEHVDGALERL